MNQRNKENKGLPARWRFRHGALHYGGDYSAQLPGIA